MRKCAKPKCTPVNGALLSTEDGRKPSEVGLPRVKPTDNLPSTGLEIKEKQKVWGKSTPGKGGSTSKGGGWSSAL